MAKRENDRRARERVLVVDDQPSQLETLVALLEEEGFQAVACTRGAEALAALAQGSIAVAVVDLRLPDLSTEDLLDVLRTWSDQVPIIIHTAFASYESARKAVNLGIFAYVEKGGHPDELIHQVHRACQSRLRRHAEALEQAVQARTRELQEANAALRESETRFRELFENMSSGVAVYKALGDAEDFIFVGFNQAAERIDKARREDLLGRRVSEAFPGVKALGLFEVFQRVWRTGKAESHPASLYEDRRLTQWVENTVFRLPSGEIVVLFDDVTDRMRAEQSLRETTQTLQAVIHASPLPIFAVDRERIVKTWNPAAERTFGWDAQEVIGRRYPAIPEEKMAEADALFSRALESGLAEVEALRQRKDGSLIDVSISAAPLRDSRGNINGVMAVLADITERKRAEESLRESEERFRGLYEKAPLGYQSLDAQGRFIDVNQAWLDLLGYSRDQVIGRLFADFLSPHEVDGFKERFPRFKATGEVHVDLEMVHRTGSTVIVHVDGRIGHDERGQFRQTHCILHDITARRAQEQKIIEYQRQLKALASELTVAEERLRRDVASRLHDGISQTLAMMKVQIESLRAAASDAPLQAALAGIVGPLDQILQETRVLTAELTYPALDVLGFPKAAERWLYDEVQVRHGIETVFEDDMEDKPLGDDMRAVLFRSVRELLTNVVKHAHATRVVVSITRAGDRIAVVVEDNGVGFDPEKATAASGGFGILSVRQALERLGGSINIESRPQVGSKITLSGPLKVGRASEKTTEGRP